MVVNASAYNQGGAFMCKGSSECSCVNCSIVDASALTAGGLVFVQDSASFLFEAGSVSTRSALTSETGRGSFASVSQTALLFVKGGSKVVEASGGLEMIFAGDSTDVTIEDATLATTSSLGVLTAAQFSVVRVSQTQVSGGNVAGGGCFVLSGNADVTLNRVVLSECVCAGSGSDGDGGGIAATDASSVHLIDVTVTSSRAVRGGGIFVADSAMAEGSGVTLQGNVATRLGGGLYSSSSTPVAIAELFVKQNTAAFGGGLFVESVLPVLPQVGVIVIRDNIALQSGGGLAIGQFNATASAGTVFDVDCNTAAVLGSAVFYASRAAVPTVHLKSAGSVATQIARLDVETLTHSPAYAGQLVVLLVTVRDGLNQRLVALTSSNSSGVGLALDFDVHDDHVVLLSSSVGFLHGQANVSFRLESPAGIVPQQRTVPVSLRLVGLPISTPPSGDISATEGLDVTTVVQLSRCPTGLGLDGGVCRVCPPGTYVLEGQELCRTDGCDGGRRMLCAQGMPQSATNFWLYCSSETGACEPFACVPGQCEAGNMCDAHRDVRSPLCGRCLRGYSEWGGECVPCPASSSRSAGTAFGQVCLVLVGAGAVVAIHIYSASTSGTSGMFAIIVNFWQWAVLIVWPRGLVFVRGLVNLDAFGVAHAGGSSQCLWQRSVYEKMALSALSPLLYLMLAALVLWLVRWCHSRLSQRQETKRRPLEFGLLENEEKAVNESSDEMMGSDEVGDWSWEVLTRTLTSIAISGQQALTLWGLSYFACRHVGGGVRVLALEPAAECDSAAWKSWLPLFALLLVATAAAPLALWWFLRTRVQTRRDSPEVRRFSNLFAPFARSKYYWEAVNLLRKFVFVSVFVVTGATAATSSVRVLSLSVTVQAFLILHIVAHPYVRAFDIAAELACLSALVVVAFLELGAQSDLTAPATTEPATLVVLIGVTLCLLGGRLRQKLQADT